MRILFLFKPNRHFNVKYLQVLLVIHIQSDSQDTVKASIDRFVSWLKMAAGEWAVQEIEHLKSLQFKCLTGRGGSTSTYYELRAGFCLENSLLTGGPFLDFCEGYMILGTVEEHLGGSISAARESIGEIMLPHWLQPRPPVLTLCNEGGDLLWIHENGSTSSVEPTYLSSRPQEWRQGTMGLRATVHDHDKIRFEQLHMAIERHFRTLNDLTWARSTLTSVNFELCELWKLPLRHYIGKQGRLTFQHETNIGRRVGCDDLNLDGLEINLINIRRTLVDTFRTAVKTTLNRHIPENSAYVCYKVNHTNLILSYLCCVAGYECPFCYCPHKCTNQTGFDTTTHTERIRPLVALTSMAKEEEPALNFCVKLLCFIPRKGNVAIQRLRLYHKAWVVALRVHLWRGERYLPARSNVHHLG